VVHPLVQRLHFLPNGLPFAKSSESLTHNYLTPIVHSWHAICSISEQLQQNICFFKGVVMKRSIQILALFSIVTLASTTAWAQFGFGGQHRGAPVNNEQCFNDQDGDGLCDYCGEPCVRDGDGDGLCDSCGAPNGNGPNGNGPGDGTGNAGDQPKDGTGYGAGSGRGTGDCDGTGPSADRTRLNRGNRGARR